MMTENVKKHVTLWSAVLVSIALVGSAVSMVLWCHAFERLLYAYKLNVGHEVYRIVRAYTPLLFVMLACMTILPHWRVAGLMAVAGLGAAGIALHVGVFIRGASGCCGPPVSTLLVAGGLSYSVVFAGLGMTGVMCSTPGRRAGRVGMWLIWLIVLAGTAGCGRREAAREAPRPVRVESQAARTADVSGRVTAAAPSMQPADARTMTDKILKGMDDLSAALGLQYARFSYDPSRQLEDYTNMLLALPHEEFMDFLDDYRTARGTYPSNELPLLRNLLITYMTNSARSGSGSCIDELADNLGETYVLDRGSDVGELLDCMSKMAALRKELPDGADGVVHVVDTLANFASMMLMRAILADQAAPVVSGVVLDPYVAMAEGDDWMRAQLLLARARLRVVAEPQQAWRDYAQAFTLAAGDEVKAHRYADWALYQGLQKGLAGKELLNYAGAKTRRFWEKQQQHVPLQELMRELDNPD